MPSSKGKRLQPKLAEEAKKEVQQSGEGGAPGQWTANKASRMAKKYEEKGGEYENEAGSKNKAKKGAPQPKDEGDIQDKPGQGKRKNQAKTEEAPASKTSNKRKKDDADEEAATEEPPAKKKAAPAKKAAAPKAKKAEKPKATGDRKQPKRAVNKTKK